MKTTQLELKVDFEIKESKNGAIGINSMKRVLNYLLETQERSSLIKDYFITDIKGVERLFTLNDEKSHCILDCEITSDERDWYTQFECDVRNDKSIVIDSIQYESFNCK